ncbi:MAG: hypothetical protein K6B68_14135 [Eubacterium sp.]|nr:hypothetical protein [Eubacterium sp.]
MAADVHSSDAYVEDSVNISDSGANFFVFLGAMGCVFFTILSVVLFVFGKPYNIINLIFSLIFAVIGYAYCIYIMVKYLSERHVTYNYTYNDGHLEIAKVRKNGKRKIMFSADCESMEIMGIYNSDEVWQATKNMKYKTLMSFVGDELGVNKNIWTAYFNIEGNRTKIIFWPSEELIKAMKKQYPTKVKYNGA